MAMPALAYDVGDPLSAHNFERLAALINGYCGIKIASGKRVMLEGRLRRRMRVLGVADPNDYCAHLFERGGLEDEMVHLIDAVTTNKTDFFREPAHFDFLRARILPEIAQAGRRTVKAWSAAASTGAEPYTMAMVIDQFVRSHPTMDYRILATDISTRVLAQAHSGRFDEPVIDPIPREMRQLYLRRARDPSRREVRIAPQLRDKLVFARLNLMDETYPVGSDFDVVFCRNVLIYFDRPTQQAVVQRLLRHLRPDGWLILGHSDSMVGASLRLPQQAPSVFKRS